MYAYLRGTVALLEQGRCVLDVHGVGYELLCPGRTLDRLERGKEATLQTHLHVTEDAQTLFGFLTREEKSMFLRLISVTRVGPKVALSALSTLAPTDIALAIVAGDEGMLSRVNGMGKKTAQRIILELKENIATEEAVGATFMPVDAAGGRNARQEAVTALIALGYDGTTAARAVASAAGERVEEIITQALKGLAR